MVEFLNFISQNLLLVGALICLLLIILLCVFFPAKQVTVYREEPVYEEVAVNEPVIEEVVIKEEKKNEIEELLEIMEEDLNKEPDLVSHYEIEEEEEAIISYQELVKAQQENRIKIYNDEEDVYVKPVFNNYDLKLEQDLNQAIHEVKPFKNSEVISPVFGLVEKKEVMEEELVDDDFLNSLIEFKNNL